MPEVGVEELARALHADRLKNLSMANPADPFWTEKAERLLAHVRSERPVVFLVHWSDHVANAWTEAIVGPGEPTELRLEDLARTGRDTGRFSMVFFTLGDSTRRDLTIGPVISADEFFALDWH